MRKKKQGVMRNTKMTLILEKKIMIALNRYNKKKEETTINNDDF
jgi:hypothetical protein